VDGDAVYSPRVKPSHVQATNLGLLLAVGVALLAQRFVLDLELMGWDSYPLVAASRAAGPAQLLANLGHELMGGRYPGGSFYRPVTQLAFALDHATSGLDPGGYQRTNLLLHAAGVVAVFALARRWLGAGLGCVVAALVFALHPLQLETVPVAARRADMLFTLCLVLALAVQPLAARTSRLAVLTGALLVVLSAASKETGAVALPVVAGALWILPEQGDARARARRVARLAAAPAAGFLAYLVGRTLVLGGVGGHPGSSLFGGALAGLLMAPAYARSLLMPQPWSEVPLLDGAIWILLAAGLCVGLGSARDLPRDAGAGTPVPRRVAAVLAFWLLCLLAMTGISGERASWYAVPFLPAYALSVGLALDLALRAWRERPRLGGALLGGGVALLLVASHLRFSPLLHSYPTWMELSRQERDFLDRFRSAVSQAEPGSVVRVDALPLGTGAPLERVGVRSALCLTDYSVAAYAELALPGRPVSVQLHTGGPPTPPHAGVVTVDAVPLPSPALRRAPGGSG
jgi:hypothetical protein